MEEQDTNAQSYLGPNRRDFVKAVGAAGVVGGLGASGIATAQQDGGTALVFAYDFYPGAPFSVEAGLQQSVTVDILDGPDDEGIPEIDNPSDYNGYVITYDLADSSLYSFAFSTESLQTDSTYTFSPDQANYFSTDLNLVQSTAESDGGTTGGDGGTTGGNQSGG